MLHAAMKCFAAAVLADRSDDRRACPPRSPAPVAASSDNAAPTYRSSTPSLSSSAFAARRKLVLGERDDHPIPGMEAPVADFTVTVAPPQGPHRVLVPRRERPRRHAVARPAAVDGDLRGRSARYRGPRHGTEPLQGVDDHHQPWPATASSAAATDRTGGSRWCCTGAAIPAPTPAASHYWTLQVHGRGTPTYTFYGELGSGGQ